MHAWSWQNSGGHGGDADEVSGVGQSVDEILVSGATVGGGSDSKSGPVRSFFLFRKD